MRIFRECKLDYAKGNICRDVEMFDCTELHRGDTEGHRERTRLIGIRGYEQVML
jgi:hypothetical protein